MHMLGSTVVEVRLLDEDDLKAFAAGGLDQPTTEAIEAYLLHHPLAADRVETYRRAAQQARQKQQHLM
jgi:anti-sigma factor RsiW